MNTKLTQPVSTEKRLENIERELHQIKSMLQEMVNIGNNQPIANDEIMNVNEAIKFLEMGRHILYAKCANGEVPCFRVGKLYKFKRSELIQWMDQQGVNKKIDTDDYVNRYLQAHILKG